ncbi:MAG: dipeptidase [Solirubrobacteraceae bacterium]|nr:dipeptidase [Solirubrobacteraceae bacterium]
MLSVPRIVAIGGNGFGADPPNELLESFLVKQAGAGRPRVCLVPTAGGDAERTRLNFLRGCARHDCIPSELLLFNRTVADIRAHLLAQDIVWVGGGNTVSLLAVWRAHGVDVAMRAAWEAGVLLAGVSAGMNCWFEASVTDSYDLARLDGLRDGLGFLPGSACPHYDGEAERRPTYRRLLESGFPAGYAADDGVALVFEGRELVEVLTSRDGATGYSVGRDGERALEARRLP